MEYLPIEVKELDIIQKSLSRDIIMIRNSEFADHPEWKKRLVDTEKLLKKVVLKKMKLKAES